MYFYLILAVLFVAMTTSLLLKHNAEKRTLRQQKALHTIQKGIESVVEQDSDEERKARILERIKKIGIYQCGKENLHLR